MSNTIDFFDRKIIASVYSGRDGCACGCRGTHSSKKGSITRVVNKFKANIDLVKLSDDHAFMHDNDRMYVVYYSV